MMHDLPEGQTQYDKNEALAQSRAEGATSTVVLEPDNGGKHGKPE